MKGWKVEYQMSVPIVNTKGVYVLPVTEEDCKRLEEKIPGFFDLAYEEQLKALEELSED